MHRLRATIPAARIARYDAACSGTGVDGIELYRWASSVALAVFDDLATLEVAMRSPLARERWMRPFMEAIDWSSRTGRIFTFG